MDLNSTTLKSLRTHAEKKFGKKIVTAGDCEELSHTINLVTTTKVSGQTLRRFYGLIKSTSCTSRFTLNTLAKYCGYNDFTAFEQSRSQQELEYFFNGNGSDSDYWQKSAELCKQISTSPELLAKTHLRLMSLPLARKFFIENHPLRDLLGTVYAQYFSTYLKFSQTPEARIFAYGFLFQSAFFQQNTELAELYYGKVKETSVTNNVHVIPAALKYGVQLLYEDSSGQEEAYEKTYSEMKMMRLRYREASTHSVCSFEYTVLESLIFTKRITHLKFLFENQTLQLHEDEQYISAGRKQTHEEVWKILTAVCLVKFGEPENARRKLDEINLDNLETGWKKYYSLLYYLTCLEVFPERQSAERVQQCRTLIEETNFCFFKDMLERISAKTEVRKILQVGA